MLAIGGNSASTGYNLTRSLRFRASASGYLNRTPSVQGSLTTWTYSLWIKRGALSIDSNLLMTRNAAQNYTGIYFDSSNRLLLDWWVSGSNKATLTTTQVFRDPSAWYHIVVAIDSTNATSSNRVKMYVNGVQITAFGTANYPPQNEQTIVNQTIATWISSDPAYPAQGYYDGYMTEINFIGGQALTPSSFGSTNALTGVWQPARYTGTYGTNGFYLPFTDNSALTTSSNAGLGKDFSGNGNYWTTNNISITAGVTYDSMTDVPTLTSATAANFAVLNPLLSSNTITFSQANLSAVVGASSSVYRTAGGTIAVNSGKWYFEDVYGGGGNCNAGVGEIAQSKSTWESDTTVNTAFWFVQGLNGNKINGDGSGTSYGSAFSTNDIIMVAVDVTNGKIWWGKNGTWFASGDPATAANPAFTNLTGKNITPAFFGGSGASGGATHTPNFGQRPFTYTPPTGFVALNTFNLPTSAIVKGNTVMDATTYSGVTGGATVTNAGAFKPDLVWMKSRNAARNHELVDSVRGVANTLFSNLTNAEATDTRISSFNSNGFTYTANSNSANTGDTDVAWQWQAGQGSSSSNTNGTITSTVSVNASAGFSVATYTGTGANATVGHGLGVAPSFIIVKSRSGVTLWMAYHISTGATTTIFLNDIGGGASDISYWNNTSPTSSVFSIGTTTYLNTSSATIVAYCFAPIAGYSAFSSFTGNGSADGPMVYTGFQPKFIIIKRTGANGNWTTFDSARDPYNAAGKLLYPNYSNAEETDATQKIDFLSNGFKIRGSNANQNASSGTYVYMAFAENPFKNSLAR